jgi:DNA-binding transcriptional LysR family regulator
MLDLKSLKVFYDVAAAGGFSAAHRSTGQSKATLSRHIVELEAALGARLMERSTRSFRLSESGQLLFERCQDIFAQLHDALAQVEDLQREPSGVVRVAMPSTLLDVYLRDEILRYMQSFPKVKVHLEASNRVVEIHSEGVDLVLRARGEMNYPQDYVTVLLARMELVLVVHPSWHAAIQNTLQATLERVPVVAWRSNSGPPQWSLRNARGELVHVALQPRLLVDDMPTLHEAALKALGMALIPLVYVQADIDAGRLERLHMDLRPPISLVHAVHLGNRGMRPAVRHLLDWLKEVTSHLR